jgi:dCMP deaminase
MNDEFGRPDWDTYFLTMCFLISQRSIDPHTKHGCVIVDKEHSVLSTGYNGPPRGVDDANIPLTRPEKYPYLVHSEENAILNAARNGISLKDATVYVTGYPCEKCFRMIASTGANKIIVGGLNSACVNDETMKIINVLNKRKDGTELQIIQHQEKNQIYDLINKTKYYYLEKCLPKS